MLSISASNAALSTDLNKLGDFDGRMGIYIIPREDGWVGLFKLLPLVKLCSLWGSFTREDSWVRLFKLLPLIKLCSLW